MSAFPVSPAVAFREFDASSVIESQPATAGSIAGKFSWGPVNERVRVSGEDSLVARFGKPTDASYVDFLLASSYLAYSSTLDVVRIGSHATVKNAVDSGVAVSVLNSTDYEAGHPTTCSFFAKYGGTLGNSLQISTCGNASQYRATLPGTFVYALSNTLAYTPVAAETLGSFFQRGDFLVVDGVKYSVTGVTNTTIDIDRVYVGSLNPISVTREWKYAYLFPNVPTTNEFHFVVVDIDGTITGEAGFVLESSTFSTVVGAKNADGTPKYYVDALRQYSSYVLAGTVVPTFPSGAGVSNANTVTLTGGADGFGSMALADYINGYDLYKNQEEVYAPLIIGGDALASGGMLAKYLTQNIAAIRKDTIVFLSPQFSSVSQKGSEVVNIIADRNTIGTAAFSAMDSNWKYTYDRYNDKFRWIPCCADHAGLYADKDANGNVWDAAAGLEAAIKGTVKLAWNPDRNARDQLYPQDVNPIFSKPTFGPILFGQKTLLGRASPLNRVPNRRIMSELEQIITKSAQALLFKVNNETSQRRFYSITEPYLRNLKGLGGIIDYVVIADGTVNTPFIVSQNKFVAKVYVKLNGFAEFILLDFTAVGANTDFSEVVITDR